MYKKIATLIMALMAMSFISFAEEDQGSEWAQDYIEILLADEDYGDGRLFSDYQSYISRRDFAYIGVKVYEALTGEVCEVGQGYFIDSQDPYVLMAKNHKLVEGYGQGLYGPNDKITRQDLAHLFNNVLKASGLEYGLDRAYTFKDEALFSSYAKPSIYTAYSYGIVEGVGGQMFDPLGYASREQAIKMLIKIQDGFEDMALYKSQERPYDWYIDQGDTGLYSDSNCGPSSVAMALKFQNKEAQVTARDARALYRPGGGWWYTTDISSFFDTHGVVYEVNDFQGYYNLKDVIDKGHIALLCMNTAYITEDDTRGSQKHRFYDYADGHFLVVKGYKKIDGEFYFEVYDPNNWGEVQENGQAKGKNRYYLASDLSKSIEAWWDYYFLVEG